MICSSSYVKRNTYLVVRYFAWFEQTFLVKVFHGIIGIFGLYRMKVRDTKDNPDSQFVAMPQTITPAGIELNPTTEPIEEPIKESDKIY